MVGVRRGIGSVPRHDSGAVPDAVRFDVMPQGVWALGIVSLFMDVSSEMIHGLLPVFLVTGMGAGAVAIGFIEGIGEATASVTKVFSGTISDLLARRKPLLALGYSLGALSKPVFALAPSVGWVFAARFSDRVGKGIRGAPRDALVADLTPAPLRGAAYGLRQSLDSVGAFAGPVLAIVVMALTRGNFRIVFWVAVIPAVMAVAVLLLGVREPERPPSTDAHRPIRLADVRTLGCTYWTTVAAAMVLTLARFSEAFLVLRAEALGLPLALAPLVLIVMNIVYSLAAYPLGALSDRMDRRILLAAGFGVLIVADVLLAVAPVVWLAMLGIGLWGLHMGVTQGLLATLLADVTPLRLRGTAFGIFHLASGVMVLLASVTAGVLWEAFGAPATFLAGAGFAALGVCGVSILTPARTIAIRP